jgi:aspartate/glutamate racemase
MWKLKEKFQMSAVQFKLGVIMLNTRFHRPVGDIGNRASFSYPVDFITVSSATTTTVVTTAPIAQEVVKAFRDAALALVARGCTAITTSCGFACAIHDELERAIPVPLVSSSLNLVPSLVEQYGWHVALPVITYDSRILNKRHFGRFWSPNVVIEGIQEGKELHRVISDGLTELDLDKAEKDVIDAVGQALSRHPSSKAILLECTNLPPYRGAIEQKFGLPVYDVFSALTRLARAP